MLHSLYIGKKATDPSCPVLYARRAYKRIVLICDVLMSGAHCSIRLKPHIICRWLAQLTDIAVNQLGAYCDRVHNVRAYCDTEPTVPLLAVAVTIASTSSQCVLPPRDAHLTQSNC